MCPLPFPQLRPNVIKSHEGAVWSVAWVSDIDWTYHYILLTVYTSGASQVRKHPRLLLIRRQGFYLARSLRPVEQDLRSRPAHSIRKPGILGTPRSWLPACMRVIRRQRLSPRVQRQQLVAPDLPGMRKRRKQRQLGTSSGAGPDSQRERKPGWRGEEVGHGRQRLPGQALGIQSGDKLIQQYANIDGSYGLGPRRFMVAYRAFQVVYCLGFSGQDSPDLDFVGSPYVERSSLKP
jgi:hypothetical protein